ncbi:MAG: helix-turn-helix domain-containing protein [Alphaproteobacteria bacterium]
MGDVATICQVSTKTVRRWIDSGVLRAAKLGMQWRIRPKDLELFVADRLQ